MNPSLKKMFAATLFSALTFSAIAQQPAPPVAAPAPASAPAQPPAPYGTPITLEMAKKAMAAAEAEARKNNWNVVTAIVDSGS
jgi:glc operon protein GlcG